MKMQIQYITALLGAGLLGATSITSAQTETLDEQRQQQQQQLELDANQEVLKASGMDLVTGLSAPGERTRLGAEAVRNIFVFNETNLKAWPDAPPEIYSFPLSLDGEVVTVVGQQHSLLAPDFKLLADRGNGVMEEIDPGPVRTYRGMIVGEPESRVTFTLRPDGVSAMIVRGDHEWYIEPIGVVSEQQTARHAVYDKRNATPLPAGFCGVGPEQMVGPMEDPRPAVSDDDASRGQPTNNGYYKTQIAFDMDYEWYQQHGSTVAGAQNETLTILNNVINIYTAQLEICYEVTALVVRTTSDDPYPSNIAETLLCDFRNHWNANHTSITYDVAHLMTDKGLSGSTVGLAYVGGISVNAQCQFHTSDNCGVTGKLNYSLSEHVSVLSRRVELMAHEIGHNWNACHCDTPAECPGAPGTGDCGIMTSSLGQFTGRTAFEGFSIGQIVARRNAVACVLDACGCGVPLTVSDQLAVAYWTSHSPCGSLLSITPGTYQGPDVAVLYRIQQGHVILDTTGGSAIIAGP